MLGTHNELAATCEAELGRIFEAKSAAAELAQQEEALAQQQKQARRNQADFMILNSQLNSIDRKLRDIRNTFQD